MALTTDEKRAEARLLREQGLTRDEVAHRLGYKNGNAAGRLFGDPAAHARIDQRVNAKRAAAKRTWEREHDRGQCPCGAAMVVGARRRGYVLCADCRAEVVAVGRAMREERIAEMWGEGHAMRDIAEGVGYAVSSMGPTMARMRACGWDLPLRRNWSPAGLAKARTAKGERRP